MGAAPRITPVEAPEVPPGAIVVRGRVAAPPAAVFEALGDSDRLDRVLGLPAAVFATERGADGLPVRVGRARMGAVHFVWEEPPYEWNAPRWLYGRRRFRAGPVAEGGLCVRVEPAPGGESEVALAVWGRPRSWLLRLAGPLLARDTRRRLRRLLAGLQAAAGGSARALTEAAEAVASAAERIRVDREALDRRAAEAVRAGASEAVVRTLVAAIATWPDVRVAPLRAHVLAAAAGVSTKATLSDLLVATTAGLVVLSWQVDCPACKVAAAHADDLGVVGRSVHCEVCEVSYGVDFADHVEAVFRPHPAVRPERLAVRCASSPAFRPHVRAQVRVPAGGRRTIVRPSGTGRLRVRTMQRPRAVEVDASRPAQVVVRVGADALQAVVAEAPADEAVCLSFEGGPRDEVLLVETVHAGTERATGRLVATVPAFYGLFGAEAARAGLSLDVGRMAILFTDLTGSTALYDRIGDAAAFEVVQAHFDTAQSAVESAGGAVVKTIGDAVMAAFDRLEEAVSAAEVIVRDTRRRFADKGLAVRAGVCEGPMLVVDANGRVDYFGTTVNLAARFEGTARAGEIVLAASALDRPAVAALAAAHPVRRFETALKGVRGISVLAAVNLARTSSEPPA